MPQFNNGAVRKRLGSKFWPTFWEFGTGAAWVECLWIFYEFSRGSAVGIVFAGAYWVDSHLYVPVSKKKKETRKRDNCDRGFATGASQSGVAEIFSPETPLEKNFHTPKVYTPV